MLPDDWMPLPRHAAIALVHDFVTAKHTHRSQTQNSLNPCGIYIYRYCRSIEISAARTTHIVWLAIMSSDTPASVTFDDDPPPEPREGWLLVRIHVPELNVFKCLQFPSERLVWDVKQQVLASLPKVCTYIGPSQHYSLVLFFQRTQSHSSGEYIANHNVSDIGYMWIATIIINYCVLYLCIVYRYEIQFICEQLLTHCFKHGDIY